MLHSVIAVTLMTAAPADLEARTDAWHQKRVARLKAEDGWLTLVGLSWLEEGDNVAGADEKAAVPLPKGAPAKLGTFTRHGMTVRFQPAPGASVMLGGKPFTGGPVKTDGNGEPEVLRSGTLQLLVIERGDRLGVRIRDSEAEARKSFHGIPRFAVTAAWYKEAQWEPSPEGKSIPVPNVLGQVSDLPLAGTAMFTHEGKEYRLLATREDDSLFFVFGDLTNRTDTYGAGRFLSAELPKDGKVVLDFNRAYNPPCGFSAYATCPLPVKENKLPLRIEAGEKRYGDH